MRLSSLVAQVRVWLVTLSLGMAFGSLGLLTQHYYVAARQAVADRDEIAAEMRGLVERLADVEAALGTVAVYRKTLDKMSLKDFESVLAQTGLRSSSEAGIKRALQVHPVSGQAGGQSTLATYTGALVYGQIIDRLGQARARASDLSADLKGTAALVSQRRDILSSIPSVMPAKGWISSEFGVRESPFHKGLDKMHNGVDIAADAGTPVFAPADGLVAFAGANGSFGKFVKLDHGFGISTRYAHNAELQVKSGQRVRRGDQIATIGVTGRTTGAHLHYEVLIHDQAVNPRRFFFDTKPEDMQAPLAAGAAATRALPMGGDGEAAGVGASAAGEGPGEGAVFAPSFGESTAAAATGWDAPVFTVEKGFVARFAPGAIRRATTADLAVATGLLVLFAIASATMRWPEPRPVSREPLSRLELYLQRHRDEDDALIGVSTVPLDAVFGGRPRPWHRLRARLRALATRRPRAS